MLRLLVLSIVCATMTVDASGEMVNAPYQQRSSAILLQLQKLSGYENEEPKIRDLAIRYAAVVFYVGPCRGQMLATLGELHDQARILFASETPGRLQRAAFAALGLLNFEYLRLGDEYLCRFAEEMADGTRK